MVVELGSQSPEDERTLERQEQSGSVGVGAAGFSVAASAGAGGRVQTAAWRDFLLEEVLWGYRAGTGEASELP